MIKPRISSIELQNGWDLESHPPIDKERFDLVVRAIIGPDPGEGEEFFDFPLCSIRWINDEIDRDGFCALQRRLAISHWDPSIVRKAIDQLISPLYGESWDQLAAKLMRFARWEFEE